MWAALPFELLAVLLDGLALSYSSREWFKAQDSASKSAQYVLLTSSAESVFIAVVALTLAILIIARTIRMLRAAYREDVADLKRLSSVVWAVLALFFGGMVAGVLLAAADRRIKRLDARAA